MPAGNVPKSKKLAKKYKTQFTNWLNRTRRPHTPPYNPPYNPPRAARSSSPEPPTRTSAAPAGSEPMASLPPRPRALPKFLKDLGDGMGYEIMPYCEPWPECSYDGGRKKHKKTHRKKRHNKKTKKRKLHRKQYRK